MVLTESTVSTVSAPTSADLETRFAALKDHLRRLERVLVAFSGGVDSTLLAAVAYDVLGDEAVAITADSPSIPRRELREALALAKQIGITHRLVSTFEMDDPNYRANPVNRCYFCKSELFRVLGGLAEAEGWAHIVYGAITDDLGDHRPGMQAAQEHQIHWPLAAAGLDKDDVRALSARYGLPTADKPSFACLSSRIPYGHEVTPAKLLQVEQAEDLLAAEGFKQFRVRHHGELARLEVPAADLPRLVEPERAERLYTGIKALGFLYVTVDLQGFRSGSMNEGLRPDQQLVPLATLLG